MCNKLHHKGLIAININTTTYHYREGKKKKNSSRIITIKEENFKINPNKI